MSRPCCGAPPRAGRSDAPPARTALFVKGEGVVTDVNLQSRAGQALVRLDGARAGDGRHPGRPRAPGHGAARCARLRPLHRLRRTSSTSPPWRTHSTIGCSGRCSDQSMSAAVGAAGVVHRRRGPRRAGRNDARDRSGEAHRRRSRSQVMASVAEAPSSRHGRSPSRSPAPWRSPAWTSASSADACTRSSARTAPGNRRWSRFSPASSSRPPARCGSMGRRRGSRRRATPARGASASSIRNCSSFRTSRSPRTCSSAASGGRGGALLLRRTGVGRAPRAGDARPGCVAARAARRAAARPAADRRDRESARARHARAADGRADLGAERRRDSEALPGHPRPDAARRLDRLHLAPARGAARDRRSADRPARRPRGRRVASRCGRCAVDRPAHDRPRRRAGARPRRRLRSDRSCSPSRRCGSRRGPDEPRFTACRSNCAPARSSGSTA